MAEREVESILREIRESVISQHRAAQEAAGISLSSEAGKEVAEAFQSETTLVQNESVTERNLSLINSYLTTTARAWDRLPPLLSNRSGLIASVELWLKRRLKRASHWFTWEQVNFNAAVHHALRDLVPVLTAHKQELQSLRTMIAHTEARLTELEQHQLQVAAQINAQLSGLHAELVNETAIRDRASDARWQQTNGRFDQIIGELRERDERLQDEQRVCFKQLALETTEAAVLEDRARRKTEKLLEELQQRIAQLERKKK